MAKRIKKLEFGANMDGSNMEGTKPNIKRVKLNSVNDSENAPEYPPRVSLGRKRIDWKKKGKTPTSKGGSGSMNAVGNFGAAIEKEDGGNGALDSGAGTVFTSTNAGIFSPTHGETQRVKSKKKRSGIERLGVFLTDGSPEKKMKKKAAVLKEWVEKQEEEELPKFVEEEGEEDTSNRAVVEQRDMENKIAMINDEEKKKEDDNKPSADIASAHITDVQLAKEPMAFGNPQDDELKRGSKKDKSKSEHETDFELDYQLSESMQKEFDILNERYQKQEDEFLYNLLWKEDEKEIPIKKAGPVYTGPPSAKYLMRI